MNSKSPVLSLVIPAYNEENAIGDVLEKALGARDYIVKNSPIGRVEIIAVDDGSTDRTAEIIRRYSEVRLVSFERNRGYGVAIMSGFDHSGGELCGFMDADGTCDARSFARMGKALMDSGADMVIGSRLSPESEMPRIRKIGNLIYIWLLRILSGTRIEDCASGIRVLRRSILPKLLPLPDGLDFTPAMSCHALMNPRIKIISTSITYRERIGKSKLSVVHDGYRFLKTILLIAFSYSPLKFFGALGALLLALSLGYSAGPLVSWITTGHTPPNPAYRLVSILVGFVAGINLIILGLLASEVVSLLNDSPFPHERMRVPWLKKLLTPGYFIAGGIFCLLAAFALNAGNLYQYLLEKQISSHWTYIVIGGILTLVGIAFFSYGFIQKLLLTYEIKLARQRRGE